MPSTFLDEAVDLGDRLLRIAPTGLPPFLVKILAETAGDLAVILVALEPENVGLLEAGDVRRFEGLRGLLQRSQVNIHCAVSPPSTLNAAGGVR